MFIHVTTLSEGQHFVSAGIAVLLTRSKFSPGPMRRHLSRPAGAHGDQQRVRMHSTAQGLVHPSRIRSVQTGHSP